MTEHYWLFCGEPTPLLEFMKEKTSERKLRLFIVACCHRIPLQNLEEVSLKAIEVAERFADGTATEKELATAKNALITAYGCDPWSLQIIDPEYTPNDWAAAAASCAVFPSACPGGTADTASHRAAGASHDTTWKAELLWQAGIVRDLFGNPFRPITISASWFTPSVLSLAKAAYDNHNLPSGTLHNERFAILADALEDAGCDNTSILNHCRQEDVHVRGCWLLDLLLGKQ